MKKIALTPGEPAGIGPDITLLAAQQAWPFELVAFADLDLLQTRALQLGLTIKFKTYDPDNPQVHEANTLCVHHIPLHSPVQTGTLDPANATYVLKTLELATLSCLENQFEGLVTGPVHKGVINDAGIHFTGHTEFLQKLCACEKVVMLLANDTLRVALATTHVPLKDVPSLIEQASLEQILHIIHEHWLRYYQQPPKILVAGLNPHAGESGHLGREDIDVIQPAVDIMQTQGLDVHGPFSADTIFNQKADVFLAMYHDQGLPVVKYSGFGKTVNITLGLPFLRTSVDHGTALSLAGTGEARADSMLQALAQHTTL